ncbi:MAG: DegV family protein [Eggerthellaceae bacterium]|nr:DegV family protein [Eggerthellaceae bacterium]
MGVRIIVDSGSDMELAYAAEHGVWVIPLKVAFADGEFAQDIDLSREDFYARLVESDDIPSTSQVPPVEFQRAFDSAVAAGDDVVCVCLSSKLSGTYDSACAAAAAHPGRVFVVDSMNATIGERLLAERAIALRDEGLGAQAIAEQLEAERGDICLLGLLDTLEFLKKGGRISSATAAVGGLLSIKPVVSVVDGEVVMVGKARGSKQGNNLLRQKIVENGGVDFSRPVWLGYAGLDDALLRKYVQDSRELYDTEIPTPPVSLVGSVIGTHVGPGAIAVAFFMDK